MRFGGRRALGLGLALWAGAAAAQDAAPDCDAAETQMEMTQCAGLAWEEADADLNAAYQAARAALRALDEALPEADQGAADRLRQAQGLDRLS